MRILIGIPIFNFAKCLPIILKNITDFYKGIDYKIVIYDDSNIPAISAEVKNICIANKVDMKIGNFSGLISAFEYFLDEAQQGDYNFINIIEHDIILEKHCVESVISVAKDPFKIPLGSVSAMYKWKTLNCYPVHKHWLEDGLNIVDGRKKYDIAGTVTDVGQPGVPFGFSIWSIDAFKHIKDQIFPMTWKLDSVFGEYIHQLGFHHLRCIDVSSEHFNGGVKSHTGIKSMEIKRNIERGLGYDAYSIRRK